MNAGVAERLTVAIDESSSVSALFQLPPAAVAEPQVLGVNATPQTVKPATATTFALAAKELRTNLFRERSFMATSAPTVPRVASMQRAGPPGLVPPPRRIS